MGTGCASYQVAIDKDSWCENYEPSAPNVSVYYDTTRVMGITVRSNRSLIGSGSSRVTKGKGLRIVSGPSNIII